LVRGADRVGPEAQHVPVGFRHKGLARHDGDVRCARQARQQNSPGARPQRRVPVVDRAVGEVEDQVFAVVVRKPQPQGLACQRSGARTPRKAAPCARAPARSEDRDVEADVDLIRRDDRAAATAGRAACCHAAGIDVVGAAADDVDDLMLFVQVARRDAVKGRGAGKGHVVPEGRTVARVGHADDPGPNALGLQRVGAEGHGPPDRRDVVERTGVLKIHLLVRPDEQQALRGQRHEVVQLTRRADKGSGDLLPAADPFDIPRAKTDFVSVEPATLVRVVGALAVDAGAEYELGQRHLCHSGVSSAGSGSLPSASHSRYSA
jgi:hypothetical protein